MWKILVIDHSPKLEDARTPPKTLMVLEITVGTEESVRRLCYNLRETYPYTTIVEITAFETKTTMTQEISF
jgi:hypothetical protein